MLRRLWITFCAEPPPTPPAVIHINFFDFRFVPSVSQVCRLVLVVCSRPSECGIFPEPEETSTKCDKYVENVSKMCRKCGKHFWKYATRRPSNLRTFREGSWKVLSESESAFGSKRGSVDDRKTWRPGGAGKRLPVSWANRSHHDFFQLLHLCSAIK